MCGAPPKKAELFSLGGRGFSTDGEGGTSSVAVNREEDN